MCQNSIGVMNATICHSLPFNTTKYFTLPVYSVVLAVGLPLNSLALWALIYQMKRSIILSVYIMNLVLANILQTLTLPFWMYYSYHNHKWGLGKGACVLAGFAFRTNFYAKNNFLCLIAMERYFGLVHPLRFHRLQTMQGATRVSIACWLLVATLCAVGIGLQMQGSGLTQEHCLDGSEVNYDYSQFRLSITSLSFFIPCLLMGFFYFRVLLELRKVASLEQRAKRQIYGFVSLIIVTFFLLFMPFQVISFYRYVMEARLRRDATRSCDMVRGIFIYEHTTLCLTTLGNILDPLLYILLLKDVRAEFKHVFSFKAHRTGVLYKSEQQGVPPCVTGGDQTQDQVGI
ncbi:G-protein coupled receptor 4-like [Rhineura floridana]|uniref:G-protein coupled receptor 4-like n=1 Tax=Rhineura floridana TaxID=261503 RepID=UPI002AC8272C|nr:G-protein coupled receptor 4-like [Rhineura floridana]